MRVCVYGMFCTLYGFAGASLSDQSAYWLIPNVVIGFAIGHIAVRIERSLRTKP